MQKWNIYKKDRENEDGVKGIAILSRKKSSTIKCTNVKDTLTLEMDGIDIENARQGKIKII